MTVLRRIRHVGQAIVDVEEGVPTKVELLSRVDGVEASKLEEFFESLTPKESLDVVLKQFELATSFYGTWGVPCSINVDNKILLNESTRAELLERLTDNKTPVTFEFTEIFPMPPAQMVNPIFGALRDCSVEVALDDFGTGFNGMSLFVDYDFDVVKVDRVLISDIASRTKKAKVLGLICDMIKSLGKSHVVEGLDDEASLCATGTAREHAFCNYTIVSEADFEVLDATLDPRFADNPLVTGAPHIVYYCGVPITAKSRRLGALCILDTEARPALTHVQRRILSAMAEQVGREIENRRVIRQALASLATSLDLQMLQ